MAGGDTICARATPDGRGGVAILRASGPAVRQLAEGVLGTLPPPREALYRRFRNGDGETLDRGIALFFPGPGSFTGEDVLELQGHGGPVVVEGLLRRCVSLGARRAEAGEFSARAYANGRLDLAQAEAVADLVAAQSERGARAALRSLEGAFSRRAHALAAELGNLRIDVESAIDFAEEAIEALDDAALHARLEGVAEAIDATLTEARRGRALAAGASVVIAGRPNAGKSSLLNALLGDDAAIVTTVPGTTRDVLREHLNLDGLPLHLIDTAGLRESSDIVERAGVARAREAMARADHVLLVVDCRYGLDAEEQALIAASKVPVTVIRNKIDLGGPSRGGAAGEPAAEYYVSARTGAGLEALTAYLKATAGLDEEAGAFSARQRHIEALGDAAAHVTRAGEHWHGAMASELVAEDLHSAQQAIGRITGGVTSDALLGEIFARFCIGK